jgi:hypothetical protein
VQPWVGHGERFLRRKPASMRAFVGPGLWIFIASDQQIPHVIVAMPAWPGMHIHMDELRAASRVRHCHAQLFDCLAHCGLRWMFAGIDVPTWLQPQSKSLV